MGLLMMAQFLSSIKTSKVVHVIPNTVIAIQYIGSVTNYGPNLFQ